MRKWSKWLAQMVGGAEAPPYGMPRVGGAEAPPYFLRTISSPRIWPWRASLVMFE